MTLVMISKASFPIRTGTSPSNRYLLFALVPTFFSRSPYGYVIRVANRLTGSVGRGMSAM